MYPNVTVVEEATFKGTPVEAAFRTLLELGFSKNEFAIAGSSGLHLLSTTALSRGFSSLIDRAPHDIDVLVVGNAKRTATEMGIRIESKIGRGYLISLQLRENKGDLLDITTDWPVGARIRNVQELSDNTQEVNGILVVNPGLILELKDKFNRVKDRPDIVSVQNGLHQNRALVGFKTPGFRS